MKVRGEFFMKKAFLLFSLLFILCSSIFPYGGKFEKKSYNDSITLELCESSSSRCTFRIKNFEINKKTYISFYRQDESFQRMQVKVDSKSIGYYNPFYDDVDSLEKLLTKAGLFYGELYEKYGGTIGGMIVCISEYVNNNYAD